MAKILISGGTGLVGHYLSKKLKEKGYSVFVLSRKNNTAAEIPTYVCDPEKKELDNEALQSVDYIIHLAGENIGGKRWSANRKKLIVDSRVKYSKLLYDKIKEKTTRPKAFISASAIGYYGAITSDKIFQESDPPANDFLGETCRLWEQSVKRFEEMGIRTVIIRTGIVLTNHGGVLEKMLLPIKAGFGSALGDGNQYIPWIHIDDLCSIYIKAIEDLQMNGAYNAVAPEHITNRNFTKTIASVMKKPFWFPDIPAFALKIFFGEMSTILLKGSRISAEKIIKSGFNFKYPTLQDCMRDLYAE